MLNWYRNRKLRKQARICLHHARHCRNMREDVAAPADLSRLQEADQDLAAAMKAGDTAQIETCVQTTCEAAAAVMPSRSFASVRENLEVIVVAVAVAMAFRTYFIQPFKIPTGSMQPTLNGITSVEQDGPGFMDRVPLKQLKWLFSGDAYMEVRAKAAGTMSNVMRDKFDPSIAYFFIVGKRHRVPIDAIQRMELRYRPGEYVPRDAVIWSGIRKAGDHVFVDKLSWNFRKPRRGQIMVFSTQNIRGLPAGTHYIKRLIGRPGETIRIVPPDIEIDGAVVREPEGIRRIAELDPGYNGFQLVGQHSADPGIMLTTEDRIDLAGDRYFALGDNTTNSKDGRYWGTVPQRNLLGPAFLVYWPFTRRWGVPK